MALNSGKKTVSRNRYLITISDTVIDRFNTLDGDQPKLLTFRDRYGRLIGYVETPGLGAYLDEVEVGNPGVDAKLEEEELEIPYMEPKGNVELQVLYMEGQDPPTQVIEINDPDIPQYPIIIAPETALDVPADPEGPTKV